jgi:hypothetical protein
MFRSVALLKLVCFARQYRVQFLSRTVRGRCLWLLIRSLGRTVFHSHTCIWQQQHYWWHLIHSISLVFFHSNEAFQLFVEQTYRINFDADHDWAIIRNGCVARQTSLSRFSGNLCEWSETGPFVCVTGPITHMYRGSSRGPSFLAYKFSRPAKTS